MSNKDRFNHTQPMNSPTLKYLKSKGTSSSQLDFLHNEMRASKGLQLSALN